MYKLYSPDNPNKKFIKNVYNNRTIEEIITTVSSIEEKIFEQNPMISHFAQCYSKKPFPAIKYASKIPSLPNSSNKKQVIKF